MHNLSPQILLVRWPLAGSTETVSFPQATSLRAGYFNHFSEELERTLPMPVGPITLSFAKDERFPGWCYVQQWNAQKQRHYCTCYKHRRDETCEHEQYLEQLDCLTA